MVVTAWRREEDTLESMNNKQLSVNVPRFMSCGHDTIQMAMLIKADSVEVWTMSYFQPKAGFVTLNV